MNRSPHRECRAVQDRSFEIKMEEFPVLRDRNQIPRIPLRSCEPPDGGGQTPVDDLRLTATHRILAGGREFIMTGNALLCRCPDCSAPMTVRLWLGLGDCWRCQCSLVLDSETIEILQEQLRNPIAPRNSPSVESWSIPKPQLRNSFSATATDERLLELERLSRPVSATQWLTEFLNSLPAWLVSFLLHLFLILVLALFVYRHPSPESLSLVLSTFLDPQRVAGGTIALESPDRMLADDLTEEGAGEAADPEPATTEEARRDAEELVIDPEPVATPVDLQNLRALLAGGAQGPATFAARDPRLRREMVEQEGGTTLSEAAVARGLRWLASVQNVDGSWSLANYSRHANPANKGDAAATSLALLPFLGAGQTHEFGLYKGTVTRGLAWLMKQQKANGDLRANFPGQAGMYAHGQATICLCEAYSLTGDERFSEPALKAIRFIERAQHRGGGWRYEPGQAGDTSVFGWQLMALQSAKASNLGADVAEETWRLADYFLDTVSTSQRVPDGALYRYQPNDGEFTAAMTAEAILCRMYLGWRRDDPRLVYALRWLLKNHPPSQTEANLYYWYYATQAFHHFGGQEWNAWNDALRDLLIGMQQTRGRFPGSWNPDEFAWGQQGERIFVTSLAVCTLEVYYRHLPLFKPLKLGDQ